MKPKTDSRRNLISWPGPCVTFKESQISSLTSSWPRCKPTHAPSLHINKNKLNKIPSCSHKPSSSQVLSWLKIVSSGQDNNWKMRKSTWELVHETLNSSTLLKLRLTLSPWANYALESTLSSDNLSWCSNRSTKSIRSSVWRIPSKDTTKTRKIRHPSSSYNPAWCKPSITTAVVSWDWKRLNSVLRRLLTHWFKEISIKFTWSVPVTLSSQPLWFMRKLREGNLGLVFVYCWKLSTRMLLSLTHVLVLNLLFSNLKGLLKWLTYHRNLIIIQFVIFVINLALVKVPGW